MIKGNIQISEARLFRMWLPFVVVLLVIISCADNERESVKPKDTSFEKLSEADAALKDSLPDEVTADNHSYIMDAILGKPKHEIRSIGILVYDGVNDLDLMNPRYVFGQVGVKVQLIGLKPGPFKTVMGLEIGIVKMLGQR